MAHIMALTCSLLGEARECSVEQAVILGSSRKQRTNQLFEGMNVFLQSGSSSMLHKCLADLAGGKQNLANILILREICIEDL